MSPHCSNRASAVTSLRPEHLCGRDDEPIRGVLVLEVDGTTGERHIDGDRGLHYRDDSHRLPHPAMGVGFERHATTLGKQKCFPHADGGKPEFAFMRYKGPPHRVGKSLRVEQAPQPDVRIEQESHLIECFPDGEIRRGSNEVPVDLTMVLHGSQPIRGRIRRRR